MRPSPSTATPLPPSSPRNSPPPSPSATSIPATAITPTSTSSSPTTTSTVISSPPHCATPPTTAASDYVRSAKQSPTCPPGAKPHTPHGDDAKARQPKTTQQTSPTSSPPSPRSPIPWQPAPRMAVPGTRPPELGRLYSRTEAWCAAGCLHPAPMPPGTVVPAPRLRRQVQGAARVKFDRHNQTAYGSFRDGAPPELPRERSHSDLDRILARRPSRAVWTLPARHRQHWGTRRDDRPRHRPVRRRGPQSHRPRSSRGRKDHRHF